jgi:hypothetical protein
MRTRNKFMPEQQTIERARNDKREGKSASTQAGEFIREEMHHIREGKHGARNNTRACGDFRVRFPTRHRNRSDRSEKIIVERARLGAFAKDGRRVRL